MGECPILRGYVLIDIFTVFGQKCFHSRKRGAIRAFARKRS